MEKRSEQFVQSRRPYAEKGKGRILYLTPTSIFSGGERVTLSIAENMQKCGYQTLYCGLNGPIQKRVEEAGVSFVELRSFTIPDVLAIANRYQPNLIHAMDFRASTFSALTGVPFIAHLHNNCPWLRHYGPQSLATLFFGMRAKRIVTVSDSVMGEFVFRNALQNKATVLPNVVDIDGVKRLAEASSGKENAYDVGFIGRFTEQKQPLRFVRLIGLLAQKLPGIKAVMIGDGEMQDEVAQCITANGLQDVIACTGYLDNPFPVLNVCRIVMMPSKWEGFGLTAVESMALGKPVLASPVGGLADIVTDECGALCETDEAYVEEACQLLTQEERRMQKGAAAAARAVQYADSRRYFDTMHDIYKQVLRV